MKLRALASLSGPTGRLAVGDEFEVDAQLGADLISRRVAEEVSSESVTSAEVPAAKPLKARASAKE